MVKKSIFAMLLMTSVVMLPEFAQANIITSGRLVVKQVVMTGEKTITIIAGRNLTGSAGRDLVRQCAARMAQGGAGVMVHPLVGVIITAVGAYSLYESCQDLLEGMGWPEAYVEPSSREEINICAGRRYSLSLGSKYSGYYNAMQSFTATMKSNGLEISKASYHYGPADAYVLRACMDSNCNNAGYVRANYSVTWVNGTGVTTPPPAPSTSYDYDEEALQDDLANMTDEEIQGGIESGVIESSSAPTDGVTGEGIEPKLYEIEDPEGGTDPATQEPHDTEVEPGTDQDSMSVPGYPAVPTLDTTIEAPDKKSIPDLVSGWLSNAPFMAIITDMEVTATGGQSEFIIPLPEVLGGTATMDFGEWSDLWQAMGAIIIAVAYIYGAMIIFGGKS